MQLALQIGDLQVPLLIVELFLLVATLLLLVLNRREMQSRETMMQHFSTVASVITRQEYFVAVVDALQRAEKRLFGSVSGSSPHTEEGEVIQQIVDCMSDATKRGVTIAYLLPMAPDRLQMGKRYKSSGAEVKFDPSLLVTDVRYMCVDDKIVLLGVPEKKGRNEPTKKGFTIPSESVAHLFTQEFSSRWNSPEVKSYEQYVDELVTQARASNPSTSVELIASNLGVGRDDVEFALKPKSKSAIAH